LGKNTQEDENMKKIYKKEEGVSPVIATILMVAITVVLAATVWLLVSGYMGGGTPPLQGTLQYDYQSSNLDADYANFTLLLSQPSGGLNPGDVHITVAGHTLSSSDWSYVDVDANGKLSNGDILVIHSTYVDHGVTVTLGATGYSGSITVTIP